MDRRHPHSTFPADSDCPPVHLQFLFALTHVPRRSCSCSPVSALRYASDSALCGLTHQSLSSSAAQPRPRAYCMDRPTVCDSAAPWRGACRCRCRCRAQTGEGCGATRSGRIRRAGQDGNGGEGAERKDRASCRGVDRVVVGGGGRTSIAWWWADGRRSNVRCGWVDADRARCAAGCVRDGRCDYDAEGGCVEADRMGEY